MSIPERPLLFLDHDGVLDSRAWLDQVTWTNEDSAKHTGLWRGEAKFGSLDRWAARIDPKKVALLNRITDETGAWIVTTASDRIILRLDGLQALYKRVGITGQFAGHTWPLGNAGRGAEIADFMGGLRSSSREWAIRHMSESGIAIVDDSDDMLFLRSRLVRTKTETGLLERHVGPIIRMLQKPLGRVVAGRVVTLADSFFREAFRDKPAEGPWTVSDLIRWLQTQDQGALVEVVQHTSGRGYYDQGGNATEVAFDPSLTTYTDFRGNQFVKPDAPYYNTRTLLLGETNG